MVSPVQSVGSRVKDAAFDFACPRPFLKWAGGKTKLLPELRKHVPDTFETYCEPFLGGGALFFDLCAQQKRPVRALLSDFNRELVWTYQVVRDDVERLINTLSVLDARYNESRAPDEAKHKENLFYDIRSQFNTHGNRPFQVAVYLLFLNKTCFNGLWRVNSAGMFNVPWGKYEKPVICDADNLRACSKALKNAKIIWANFQTLGENIEPNDFVYFDPPYWPVSKTANFTAYGKDGFGPVEQKRLRDFAAQRKDEGVRVLLSNADVPEVRALYLEPEDEKVLFELRRVDVARAINSKGSARGKVGELLIW